MGDMNPSPKQGRLPTSPSTKPQYPPGFLPAPHSKGDWEPFAIIMAIFSCAPIFYYLYRFVNGYIALRQSTVMAQDMPDELEEEERILDEDADIAARESTILEVSSRSAALVSGIRLSPLISRRRLWYLISISFRVSR